MERRKKGNSSFNTTSWEPVEKWYSDSVGEKGHYYHQHVIIPGVLKLLELEKNKEASLLDLGCGSGVLARHLPKAIKYVGIDLSTSLVKAAKKMDPNPNHAYHIGDVSKPLPTEISSFTHATIILAIQNIEYPNLVFQNAAHHLIKGGKLVIVMNHPCFRIPRQSSWKVDEQQKIQYRRIDRYSSSMNIPIQAHPSKGQASAATVSFHHPLATFSRWLYDAGFAIELLDEWHSDKVSEGKTAKMENRSRTEIPLFLAIRATLM